MQFTQCDANQWKNLCQPAFFQGVEMSRQWRWERQNDRSGKRRTDCVIALVPTQQEEDFSFVVRVGHRAGWELVRFLGFDQSVVHDTSSQEDGS
jgi:hypothetical protein